MARLKTAGEFVRDMCLILLIAVATSLLFVRDDAAAGTNLDLQTTAATAAIGDTVSVLQFLADDGKTVAAECVLPSSTRIAWDAQTQLYYPAGGSPWGTRPAVRPLDISPVEGMPLQQVAYWPPSVRWRMVHRKTAAPVPPVDTPTK